MERKENSGKDKQVALKIHEGHEADDERVNGLSLIVLNYLHISWYYTLFKLVLCSCSFRSEFYTNKTYNNNYRFGKSNNRRKIEKMEEDEGGRIISEYKAWMKESDWKRIKDNWVKHR